MTGELSPISSLPSMSPISCPIISPVLFPLLSSLSKKGLMIKIKVLKC